MAKTIVGIIEDDKRAQTLVDAIEALGYKNIHVLAHDSITGKIRSYITSHTGGELSRLVGLGVPQDEAELYTESVRRGGTLVAVAGVPDAHGQQVADLFHRNGVVDIDRRAQYFKQSGYTGHVPAAPAYTNEQVTNERQQYGAFDRTLGTNETVTVPVVEETLAVGKREVQRGGARVHTHLTETPVSQQVVLREEHVTVNRQTVNRPANAADLATANRTIEVTETAEVPVVAKEARVVEEVTVGKAATERTQTVSDTVRRTDVTVDELDDSEVTTQTASRH